MPHSTLFGMGGAEPPAGEPEVCDGSGDARGDSGPDSGGVRAGGPKGERVGFTGRCVVPRRRTDRRRLPGGGGVGVAGGRQHRPPATPTPPPPGNRLRSVRRRGTTHRPVNPTRSPFGPPARTPPESGPESPRASPEPSHTSGSPCGRLGAAHAEKRAVWHQRLPGTTTGTGWG